MRGMYENPLVLIESLKYSIVRAKQLGLFHVYSIASYRARLGKLLTGIGKKGIYEEKIEPVSIFALALHSKATIFMQ